MRPLLLGLAILLAGCAKSEDAAAPPRIQESPVTSNRLAREQSPYLLQHAHNPVDWYAWGPEAFDQAKKEDKPIFLSIGYSTCHWCHVMAHESFENPGVAEVMNRHFVSIKVDREERPDVDELYMSAVTRAMGQHGGWPLSVWLTPDLRPFAGGTYFPPEDRWGRKGFRSVLLEIAELWRDRKDEVVQSAGAITDFLQKSGTATSEGDPAAPILDAALPALDRLFDDRYGGFGHAPKFPQPSLTSLLLRLHVRTGERRALEMVETQLDRMAEGGIYDHLGGGFARYSTDERWLVPHFEKMLYDNAQLLKLYAETFRITRKPSYETVIRETAGYVLRDMTDPAGGFYSAEDADSEGIEGKFYVWRREEVERILGAREAAVFGLAYDVSTEGNWEDPHHDVRGLNVLNRRLTDDQVAKLEKIEVAEVRRILSEGRKTLAKARSKRVRPGLDDKILASWNGLMIGALSYAGSTLGEPRYVDAARKAAAFVTSAMFRDGRLLHRSRKGEAGLDGLLEDYAFLSAGLIDLYEATFEERWLRTAVDLADRMIELFHDRDRGGFFLAAEGRADLIARSKSPEDGALPSPANVAALTLIRLSVMTSSARFRDCADATLKAYAGAMKEQPAGYPVLLIALDWRLGPSRQIVLAGEASALRKGIDTRLLLRTSLLYAGTSAELAPLVKGKDPVDGKPAAYVCVGESCRLPVTMPEALDDLLSEK